MALRHPSVFQSCNLCQPGFDGGLAFGVAQQAGQGVVECGPLQQCCGCACATCWRTGALAATTSRATAARPSSTVMMSSRSWLRYTSLPPRSWKASNLVAKKCGADKCRTTDPSASAAVSASSNPTRYHGSAKPSTFSSKGTRSNCMRRQNQRKGGVLSSMVWVKPCCISCSARRW